MELWKQQSQFTQDVADLIKYVHSQGFMCSLGEIYRSPEQAKIYAREGKGIINSLHCKKLALDLQLFDRDGKYLADSKSYEPLGLYWETLDIYNRWGGHFNKVDGNHFERKEI